MSVSSKPCINKKKKIRESLLSGESFSFCLYTARAVNEDAADRRNPNEHGEERNRDERACARLIRESLLLGESFSFCLYTARAVNEDAADRRNPNEHGEEKSKSR